VIPEEARAIAREAYIYGYPMVDSYRIQYAYFVDNNDKSCKAPWNQIKNIPEVYTPADTAIQTPNSDTPYSFVGLDLRAEPIVISVPEIEKKRYYSIQFIDAYTFNFAYVGSRATRYEGGLRQGGRLRRRRGKDQNGWQVGGLAGGDKTSFNGDWLKRAATAKAGIYVNDPAEAMYPATRKDSSGETIDTSKNNYTLTLT